MISALCKHISILRFLPCLALLFCLAPVLRADSFDEQVGSMILLEQKPVQREIGLTEAQRAKMNVFADAHRAKLNAYYAQLYKEHKQGVDQAGQQMLLGWFADLKKKVFAQLRPDQLRRLREISLQSLGFPALGDSLVAQRVGLSSSQEQRVRAILKKAATEASSVQEQAVSQATADLQKKKPTTDAEKKAISNEANKRAEVALDNSSPQVDRIRSRAKSQVMAILTPGEKAIWEDLLGKPFVAAK